MTGDILTALSALIFVLVLLGGLAWAVKRFGLLPGHSAMKSSDKSMEIRETTVLDARSRLVIARWQGQDYLLGISQNNIELIDQKPVSADKIPMNNSEKPER